MEKVNYEEHRGLVYDTIKKTFKGLDNAAAIANKNNMALDDLVQVGEIYLWKATQKFDPSKGYAFSTYAAVYIRGGILKEIDKSSAIKISSYLYTKKERQEILASVFSMNKQIGESPEDTFENILQDDNQFEEQIISNMAIESILSVLNKNQKTVVLGRINGLSFKEIGKQIGSNNKSCENMYRRAIKKLKENVLQPEVV